MPSAVTYIVAEECLVCLGRFYILVTVAMYMLLIVDVLLLKSYIDRKVETL